MIHAWYEKVRDEKDCIYFAYHDGRYFGKSTDPIPSFHNAVEFAVCTEGEFTLAIGGRAHTLRAGEICFMNSREPHRYYYNAGVKCYIVLISASFFNGVNRLGEISYPAHMEVCEGFAAVRDYLDYAIRHWDVSSLLCKRAFADTFAYLMQRHYPHFPKPETEKQRDRLLEAVKYICEHCTERLTVGEVAAHFGYSANYFSTVWGELMGASFSDYWNCQDMCSRKIP